MRRGSRSTTVALWLLVLLAAATLGYAVWRDATRPEQPKAPDPIDEMIRRGREQDIRNEYLRGK